MADQKTMTKAELKKAFSDWDKLDKEHRGLQKQADEIAAKKSKIVQGIFESSGYGAGPYSHSGRVLTITKRNTKNEAEEVVATTYFFRGPGTREAVEV